MSNAALSKEKTRRYRERLRASGLRPVQLWVPNADAPGFAEEARRQSLLVSHSTDEQKALEFIEVDTDGWQ